MTAIIISELWKPHVFLQHKALRLNMYKNTSSQTLTSGNHMILAST